jgi:hypothetical protein
LKMIEFEVRHPIESNHRTEADSVRTSIEPQLAPGGLKTLAQRVIARSSMSNQGSNSHRTEQFDSPNFDPQNSPQRFEGKNKSISYLEPPAAAASRSVTDLAPCYACGCRQWWQLPEESWHCRACKPGMPLDATTLTCPATRQKRTLCAVRCAYAAWWRLPVIGSP